MRKAIVSSAITTAQLAAKLAGGTDYIRTKDGVVRGLALRRDLNPEAPEIIVVGKGPRIEARAKLLVDSAVTVPAYVKRGTNDWQYLGMYRGTAYRTDSLTIKKYREKRPLEKIAGILFLESADEVEIKVWSGGFADPLTRKEIEIAAILATRKHFESAGYKIFDHQKENRGYDLLATSGAESLKLEVKGTDSAIPRFFISRNERKCSTSSSWRLVVVTAARRNPQLHIWTTSEAEKLFAFEPLAWECTLLES